MAKRLDAKEQRFKEEYLVDLDPKRAAIEAGYSATTAASKAYQWVSNRKIKPHVYDAIEKAKAKRSERTEITQDMVLQELARIGFSDIRKAVTWGDKPTIGDDGAMVYPVELVNSGDVDDDTAAAISEVSLTAQGVKIKMIDKKGALDSIGKHLGMFTDKVDHTSSDGSMTPKEPAEVNASTVAALVKKLTD